MGLQEISLAAPRSVVLKASGLGRVEVVLIGRDPSASLFLPQYEERPAIERASVVRVVWVSNQVQLPLHQKSYGAACNFSMRLVDFLTVYSFDS
jgi:hypothetical protein